MGLLRKILGHEKQAEETKQEIAPEDLAECPHTALTPHWDSLQDMGKEQLATYRCESCGIEFTYEESREYLDQPPGVLIDAGVRSDELG
jgi:hypothetical protein